MIVFSIGHAVVSVGRALVASSLSALAFAFMILGSGSAWAQAYPNKAIKLIVPFTPGSPVDASSRVIAQQMQARLGQNIVIDNRPGAGTTLGAKAAAVAEPDGYTLLYISNGHVFGLYTDPGYDTVKSFAPVATVAGWSQLLVVAPSIPARTVAELVTHAKANPGKVTFGFGLGTPPQIMGEYLKALTGADIVSVPYRGGVQAITDMLGGRIHMYFGPVLNLLPHIRADKMRPLATTSAARYPELPDVPTMAESGFPQLELNAWTGILAPAGTPAAVIGTLNAAIADALKSSELQKSFAGMSFDTKVMSPQQFTAFFAAEAQRWPPIIQAAGIKPE
jgi:tripartite-type tricarboxylate transporter receptor subunit TctC